MTQILETLYSRLTGHAPASVEALPGAGSNRSYYRLKGNPTLIGVCGTSREENEAFIYLSHHFRHSIYPCRQYMLFPTTDSATYRMIWARIPCSSSSPTEERRENLTRQNGTC